MVKFYELQIYADGPGCVILNQGDHEEVICISVQQVDAVIEALLDARNEILSGEGQCK